MTMSEQLSLVCSLPTTGAPGKVEFSHNRECNLEDFRKIPKVVTCCPSCLRATFWRKLKLQKESCALPKTFREPWMQNGVFFYQTAQELWPGRKTCCIRIRRTQKEGTGQHLASTKGWKESRSNHPEPINSTTGPWAKCSLLF